MQTSPYSEVVNTLGKIIKKSTIFIFRVMGENSLRIVVILSTKTTITPKKKNNCKIGNLIFHSFQAIPYLLRNFQKFWTTFFSKVFKFTWKIWNRPNRKKNQIFDLWDFYFSSSGHFFTQNDLNFRWIFTHNWKNKNRKINLFRFSFYSAHYASFIKIGPLLGEGGGDGGGVCISLIGMKPLNLCENNFPIFSFWDMVDFVLKIRRKFTTISP